MNNRLSICGQTKWHFGLIAKKTDPNVAAIRVIPTIAEYWDVEFSAITRIWEIAKSKITGGKPDLGENETVRLAS